MSGNQPRGENVQDLVDAAERRREAEIKRVGGKFTLVVGIPIALLVLWAAVFLTTYDPGPSTPAEPAPLATTGELTPEQKDMAQYDMFLDEKDRVVKTNVLGLEKTSGQLIDKEDIHFAMELLNFMQPHNQHPKEIRH